jgi:hypothetical protein
MRPSERLVFFVLLERANNDDCAVPDFMTPSLVQLADDTGLSKKTVRAGLNHLESHGWVHRARSAGGRGHKTGYRLDHGCECDCPKQEPQSPFSSEKQGTERPQKQGTSIPQNGRSAFVPHVGSTEGRTKEGQLEPAASSHWPAGSIGDEANLLTLFEISPLQPQPPQARL